MTNDLGINGDRLFQSLMEMERISALPAGGCERLALTDDDQIARWAEEAGCSVTPDRLGDMFARRPDRNSDPPPIAIGSSLGTQPSGDRIDGFHGVLAGLNVVRSLNDHGSKTDSPLEIATQAGCDSHMGSFFIWHILSPIETFAKVEAMSESRSIEDLPIVICCSFEWIPVFS